MLNRQPPILPGHCYPSTFGLWTLNYRVRHGNGCDRPSIVTGFFESHALKTTHRKFTKKRMLFSQALGVLVRVGFTPHRASAPRLSNSSSMRRLTGLLHERPHLREGFALRCFQRLSRPNAATQRHAWRHDWYTVGSSAPVLSY